MVGSSPSGLETNTRGNYFSTKSTKATRVALMDPSPKNAKASGQPRYNQNNNVSFQPFDILKQNNQQKHSTPAPKPKSPSNHQKRYSPKPAAQRHNSGPKPMQMHNSLPKPILQRQNSSPKPILQRQNSSPKPILQRQNSSPNPMILLQNSSPRPIPSRQQQNPSRASPPRYYHSCSPPSNFSPNRSCSSTSPSRSSPHRSSTPPSPTSRSSPSNFASSIVYQPPTPSSLPRPPIHWTSPCTTQINDPTTQLRLLLNVQA